MAKALVCSDLHVHNHKDSVDRLQHCLDVLRWTLNTAEEQGCEYYLFLGDLFHEKSKIDVLNYLRTFEVFMEHFVKRKSSMKAYMLIGNHDMYHRERWDVNSVKPLSALPQVEIVDRPCTIEIGGVDVDFCPHTHNPLQHLSELAGKKRKRRLLLGHLAVHGAVLNKMFGTTADVIVEHDSEMVRVTPDHFDPWDMTILGHYHASQQLTSKAEYIGSPLQLSFGEAFQDKHVMVLDLDTLEKRYIENDFSPRHYIIPASDEDTYDLNGHFVRVLVGDMTRRDLLEVQQRFLDKYKVASFDFKEDESRRDRDVEVVDEAKVLTDNHEETMRSFVEAAVLPDDIEDRDLLLKIGFDLCQKVS